METKTIILGTAGHIDHGKTTLVKAVTGIDTDRLKEEKERGITIELGFAHLDLPSGRRVGVVDVPGHERFVKNMVAGAMGMDLVALVVAADEGVMPQTREHLEICQLLGVKKGLIVLTKKDMVDEEWLDLVTEDVRDFVAGTFLDGAPLLAVSSTTGDGIEDFIDTVDHLVSEVTPKAPVGPYRLPVDRVFSVKGFGTVVTGTSISGHISVGDDVCIYPRGLKSKIRGIQIHGGNVQEAQPGLRTALNLHGIDREQVVRGDVVSLPDSLHPSYLLDLQFLYLASADRRLKHRSPVRFHVGTAEVIGRMYLQGDEVLPGTEAFAQIKLDDPVAVLPGDHYVIRSYSPIRTIGGGRILHPVPRKRKRTRPELWEELKTIAGGVPEELISYHVERSGIRGLSQPEIAMRSGVYGKRLDRELERLLSVKKVVKLDAEGQKYLHGTVYQGLKAKAVTILEAYHNANPLVQGLSKEELKSRLFPRLVDSRIFQRLLADMVKSGDVLQEKDLVRLSSHRVALGEEEAALRKRLAGLLRESGLQPPSRTEAFDRVGVDRAAAAKIFDLLVREGELVRVKEDLFFHRVALENLKDMVVRFIKERGELGINDFRDLTGGLSRKYMIPLLEYLDNQHVTLRIGDTRKLRG